MPNLRLPLLRPALCLTIFIASLPAALGAEPIRVSGQVVSPDDSRGVAGVHVELLPAWEGYAEGVRRLRETSEPRRPRLPCCAWSRPPASRARSWTRPATRSLAPTC